MGQSPDSSGRILALVRAGWRRGIRITAALLRAGTPSAELRLGFHARPFLCPAHATGDSWAARARFEGRARQ